MVLVSHTWTWNAGLKPVTASVRPSGENMTEVTSCAYVWRATSRWLAASQILSKPQVEATPATVAGALQ
jgi:hypothetical protein